MKKGRVKEMREWEKTSASGRVWTSANSIASRSSCLEGRSHSRAMVPTRIWRWQDTIEEVNGWTQEDGKGLPWPPRRSISLSFFACSEYRGLYEATCFTWPWSGRGVWCVNSLATVILAKLRIMSKLSRPTFTLRAVYESERSFEKGLSFEFSL